MHTFRIRSWLSLFVIALISMFAVSFAPFFARAQTTPSFPDLSQVPTSQIGTPIALYIKCVLLQQAGPPIPDFATECAGVIPTSGSTAGSLTGNVVAPSSSTSATTGGTLSGTVVVGGTLTGQVVQTQVAGESSSGGGSSGGGGGGGGGGSPGEVAGASTSTPPGQGGFAPEMPATGFGSSIATWALLIVFGIGALSGMLYLAYTAHHIRRRRF